MQNEGHPPGPPSPAPKHYEILKYCQSTSRVQAEVLQNLRVPIGYACLDVAEGLIGRQLLVVPAICMGDTTYRGHSWTKQGAVRISMLNTASSSPA